MRRADEVGRRHHLPPLRLVRETGTVRRDRPRLGNIRRRRGAQSSRAPAPSHLEVWAKLLPRWAWIIIGTMAAVVVESIFVRLVTPAGSAIRTTMVAYAVGDWRDRRSPACMCSIFCSPLRTTPTPVHSISSCSRLSSGSKHSRTCRRGSGSTNTAAAGLTAAVMSVVVIGGLPYERLWDWGFKQPPKQNLLGAVASQVAES